MLLKYFASNCPEQVPPPPPPVEVSCQSGLGDGVDRVVVVLDANGMAARGQREGRGVRRRRLVLPTVDHHCAVDEDADAVVAGRAERVGACGEVERPVPRRGEPVGVDARGGAGGPPVVVDRRLALVEDGRAGERHVVEVLRVERVRRCRCRRHLRRPSTRCGGSSRRRGRRRRCRRPGRSRGRRGWPPRRRAAAASSDPAGRRCLRASPRCSSGCGRRRSALPDRPPGSCRRRRTRRP